MPIRIFISSVQKEFKHERASLRDYLRNDPLMRRFCEVFLFEDVSAGDKSADRIYLGQVDRCTIYIGLFGIQYGNVLPDGMSPTEKEFRRATEKNKHRLIFVKGDASVKREAKMQHLINIAEKQLTRRRFMTLAELIAGVYASIVEYLAEKGMLQFGPFDTAICANAKLADMSMEKIRWFVRRAHDSRGFPLDESAKPKDVLTHLRLLRADGLTNAAVLLFAKEPQRFIYSSEIKCAHFHGTTVHKPIPFYQVYKGNLFELVDQAVNFVLSKIDLAVGTRDKGPQAPVAYEMPREVIAEAIVNAVAHRDYASTASVQVMLFSDRLEVWNPGTLTSALTIQALRKPHGSYPVNPLIAEPLYLTEYIERMGTGIPDMYERCRNFGIAEPDIKLTDGFVLTLKRKKAIALQKVEGKQSARKGAQQQAQDKAQDKAQDEAQDALTTTEKLILKYLVSASSSGQELLQALGYSQRTGNFKKSLANLQLSGLIEYTIPEKPKSRRQKYRITKKGKKALSTKKDILQQSK